MNDNPAPQPATPAPDAPSSGVAFKQSNVPKGPDDVQPTAEQLASTQLTAEDEAKLRVTTVDSKDPLDQGSTVIKPTSPTGAVAPANVSATEQTTLSSADDAATAALQAAMPNDDGTPAPAPAPAKPAAQETTQVDGSSMIGALPTAPLEIPAEPASEEDTATPDVIAAELAKPVEQPEPVAPPEPVVEEKEEKPEETVKIDPVLLFQKIGELLREVFYLATVEVDQPRVRPFDAAVIYQNKVYFITYKNKNVYQQLKKNPKVELYSKSNDGSSIRIAADAVENEDAETLNAIIENSGKYAGNNNAVAFYLTNVVGKMTGPDGNSLPILF